MRKAAKKKSSKPKRVAVEMRLGARICRGRVRSNSRLGVLCGQQFKQFHYQAIGRKGRVKILKVVCLNGHPQPRGKARELFNKDLPLGYVWCPKHNRAEITSFLTGGK